MNYLLKSILTQTLSEADNILMDAEQNAPKYIAKGRAVVKDLFVKVNKL